MKLTELSVVGLLVTSVACITPPPSQSCTSGSTFNNRADFFLRPNGTQGGETQWESTIFWERSDEGTRFSNWEPRGSVSFITEPDFSLGVLLSDVGDDVALSFDWSCEDAMGRAEVLFPGDELMLGAETPGTVTSL